jgi:formyltetrahydrofolate deformylase
VHSLSGLLFCWKSGLLPIDIRAIISNHRDLHQLPASYNIAFHHTPVSAATKVELVVLARYMQILSEPMCRALAGQAVNIHHSVLTRIEQGVARVDHGLSAKDITTNDHDTESQVLAHAVKWHSEHRMLLNGHKTVIFK